MTNLQFHTRMTNIYASMNDFHTAYRRPTPLLNAIVAINAEFAEYYVPGDVLENGKLRRRYTLKRSIFPTSYSDDTFVPGVEILTYNGRSIDEAALRLGRQGYAANFAARLVRGLASLTTRGLDSENLPTETVVRVGFRNAAQEHRVIVLPWVYYLFSPPPPPDVDAGEGGELEGGELEEGEMRRKLHEMPIQPPGWLPSTATRLSNMSTEVPVGEEFRGLLSADIIQTSNGPVGRMVIKSFSIANTTAIRLEYERVLRLMPDTGLILDLEKNPGGYPDVTKVLLDLISEEGALRFMSPTTFRATNFTDAFLTEVMNNGRRSNIPGFNMLRRFFLNYLPGVRSARLLGEPASSAGQLVSTPLVEERVPRVYFGPVVTVMSANTYSSGDIFSALSVDSKQATLVGLSDTTGAGGATTVGYDVLALFAPDLLPPTLPGGVTISTALTRFYRTGDMAGRVVESFGVKPDVRYYRTIRDVLQGDCEFYEFLGRLLEKKGRAMR